MAVRHANPQRVKLHRSYSAQELADCLGVHKNSIRNWQLAGLKPIDGGKPALFHGSAIRAFLTDRRAKRKRPCLPGTLYCFRCREPRIPTEPIVFIIGRAGSGNIRAACKKCGTLMHRRARREAIATILPSLSVQFVEAKMTLSGCPAPSLDCVQ